MIIILLEIQRKKRITILIFTTGAINEFKELVRRRSHKDYDILENKANYIYLYLLSLQLDNLSPYIQILNSLKRKT